MLDARITAGATSIRAFEGPLRKAGATARLTYEKSKKDFEDAKTEFDRQDAAARDAAAREGQIAHELEVVNREIAAATATAEKVKAGGSAGEIHSPTDGIVVARQEIVGQMVDPSMKELMKIGKDLTQLAVEVNDARVHDGQSAIVRLDGAEYSGRVQGGRVNFDVPMPVEKLDQPVQVIIKF